MGFITDILKEVPLSAVLREKLATAESEIEKKDVLLKDKDVLLKDKDVLLQDKDVTIADLTVALQKAREEIERFKQEPTVAMVIPGDFENR
jgi:hypothetical protein